MEMSQYWSLPPDQQATLRKAAPEPKTRGVVKTCLCRVADARACFERRQPQAARLETQRVCDCDCHAH